MVPDTEPTQPYVDPHHAVPADEWGQVVRDAQRFQAEHEAKKAEG